MSKTSQAIAKLNEAVFGSSLFSVNLHNGLENKVDYCERRIEKLVKSNLAAHQLIEQLAALHGKDIGEPEESPYYKILVDLKED